MGAKNVMRRVLDSALPDGPIWQIAEGEDLDKYYHGLAQNYEDAREEVAAIGDLRNPESTASLADLEIEFGITPDTNFTPTQRRVYLAALKGERCVLPSWVNLQRKLRAAGFDVYVFPNDPPLDPAVVLSDYSGYYLVNGDVLDHQERDYDETVCDDDGTEPIADRGTTVCDDDGTELIADRGATIGSFVGMLRYPYEYKSPTRYRWPMIFWIAATKRGGETFLDWNMEWQSLGAWTAGGDTYVHKTLEWKKTGVRSLEVMAPPVWVDPIGPYAEQMRIPIPTSRDILVRVCSSPGVKAALCVCDKDGIWDVAGIVESSAGAFDELLNYSAANGVSGVRLYLTGAAPPVVGDWARFDDLKIWSNLIKEVHFTKASLPATLRQRFEKLVYRYKPVRTWAGVLINWTTSPGVPGPFVEDDGGP